jgi:ABC-type transport system involved in multi-copper enzyme maturation permease subunit
VERFWENDLPERFDPMTVKELHQSLRRGSFVVPFLVIQAGAAVAAAVDFQRPGSAAVSGSMFWLVAAGLCVVVMPLTGILLMREELEEGNHELLVLTKLSRWRIVFGKFLGLWGLSALTFVSLLPYAVARYLMGGVEWTDEVTSAFVVLGVSAMMTAGTLGASAYKGLGAKIAVFALFGFSACLGCLGPLA